MHTFVDGVIDVINFIVFVIKLVILTAEQRALYGMISPMLPVGLMLPSPPLTWHTHNRFLLEVLMIDIPSLIRGILILGTVEPYLLTNYWGDVTCVYHDIVAIHSLPH